MNTEDLASLTTWFETYCDSFSTPVLEDQRNYAIKQVHTRHVCANARRIARDEDLAGDLALLAGAAALFHDVGRFHQYRTYRTFNDSASINHGTLGARVLVRHDALRDLPGRDRNVILRAVTLHNAFSLPAALDKESLLITRIVRDADKLDIWRVVREYYSQEPGERAAAVGLGFPDGPGYSPEVLSALRAGRMVRMANLKTQNDFRLVQLGWIYDLHFPTSLRMVLEEKYIDMLEAWLPAHDDIKEAVQAIRAHVDRKLSRR